MKMRDNMNNVNFIPSYRRAAEQRRRRLTQWIILGVAYGVFLATAIASGYAVWGGGGAALADELENIKTQMKVTTSEMTAMRGDLDAKGKTLRAEQIVVSQPDWSLLLALLARSLSDGAVLTQCDLKPEVPAGAAATAAAQPVPASFSLRLSGYGKGLPAVLQFAQELERAGLFDQIRLVKTDPEPFMSGTAIRFQMECTMGPARCERAK
jgi:hypothetical protein